MKKILTFCILSAIALAVASKAHGQAAATFSTGTFNSDAVLSLAGPVSNELYGVTWASTATTGNGCLFTHYTGTTLAYGNGGSDGVFMPAPATTGDSALNALLNNAADQGIPGTAGNFTLSGLTAGTAYNVLILDADDRTTIGGPRSITVGDGLGDTISGDPWMIATGEPQSIGTYVLATFTASGATEAFTITGSGGPQVNDVLVTLHGAGPPPKPANVTARQSNNGQVAVSWLAAAGATSYNVERATNTGGSYVVIATNLATLTYTDATAVVGTFYFYAVIANNASGTSAPAPAVFGWRVIIPTLNTNELVVTATTPQDYGAVGDGVTDDSAAFQAAINAVYNSGGSGGGVVYVPAGNYAFYNNITVQTGVTLHGDWTDWTQGTNGLVGTTFKVYVGAGQGGGTPFITMEGSASMRGINLWYPNQNPNNITPYPFSIKGSSDSVVRDVALVNSYQGIQISGETKWIFSDVVGSPLYLGLWVDNCADVCQGEGIHFSPAAWANSGLSNAPTAGGAYATWMRNNGTGMELLRLDGFMNMDTTISGYQLGIDLEQSVNGVASACFYDGCVSNCAIALNTQETQTSPEPQFTRFTLDGDVAINRTVTTNDVDIQFDDCQVTGRAGIAVSVQGASWQTSLDFQNCAINGTMQLNGPGIFNLVNCSLNAATQCVLSATATRAAFTGCTFSPAQNLVNNGNAGNLIVNSQAAASNALPIVNWTNIVADYAARRPAKTALFVATDYGAVGNNATDATAAIQNALAAAGANGGGIVYVPAGKYYLTNTLDVPSGVELRGAYELRHRTWPGADGHAKGTILEPYGGQGTTNGPPQIVLEANAGLVGMTITYETQNSNCIPFPPAIQGRGGNVYAIGIQSPNPYYYVDFDTYTCTNHFLDMLDGSALQTGFKIGHGSTGSIVDCHNNWTYWVDNYDSASSMPPAVQAPVQYFLMHDCQYYVFGNCTELVAKTFSIQQNIYMHCSSQNGVGANVTGISPMCDATYQAYVLDGAGPSTVNVVNPDWLVIVNAGYSDLTNAVTIISATNYQGRVRLFNSPIHANPNWDYIIGGGDIGLELVHGWQYSNLGIFINGGVFHLVNAGFFNVAAGSGGQPLGVTYGANAGLAGKTNEFIGCFSQYGFTFTNHNATNPAAIWGNYGIAGYPPITPIGFKATVTSTQVTLNWTASAGATSYNVKRSTNYSGPFGIIASPTGTSFTDTNVTPGVIYYYVVSALGSIGESPNSGLPGTGDAALSQAGWTASASVSAGGNPPASAIDGNINTRWGSGTGQTSGMWFQVDMKTTNTFHLIVMDCGSSTGDYPRGYQVYVSNDGVNWGGAVATGAGSSAVTTVAFTPQTARYIRVLQTGSVSGIWWSIGEFNVYATLPAAPTDVTATAGSGQVILNWTSVPTAASYNVKYSMTYGGPYGLAANVSGLAHTNTGLVNGTRYYFVVSSTNGIGEGGNSQQVSAQPVSATVPELGIGNTGGQLQFTWPQDHTGWQLEMQTNGISAGLGTNWVSVPGSDQTNQMTIPITPTQGSAFFRLILP